MLILCTLANTKIQLYFEKLLFYELFQKVGNFSYLYENPGVSRLAYLLYALRQSNHIVSCNYITFHRALQAIANKPLGGPDVPQRRYHELLADPKLLGSKGKKWQQAKAIIDRWTVLFDKNDI